MSGRKRAAFEIPDGPQRIRGLAGSGKTVVLALKAAYLHSQHPSWHIAVTFYTRALAQQYKEMITNFLLMSLWENNRIGTDFIFFMHGDGI